MRRACAFAAALLSCNGASLSPTADGGTLDPCNHVDGFCATFTVIGAVGPFDSLQVIAPDVDPQSSQIWGNPTVWQEIVTGGPISMPFRFALRYLPNGYPLGFSAVAGLAGGRVTAWGEYCSGVCDGPPIQLLPRAAPLCQDGGRDGSESDVDCGETCSTKCIEWQHCSVDADCDDTPNGGPPPSVCINGICRDQCNDGVKEANETDVDCGGVCAYFYPFHGGRCGVGEGCIADNDCTCLSGPCMLNTSCYEARCINSTCADPCKDGLKDYAETDVDCGRRPIDLATDQCGAWWDVPACPPCGSGKRCVANTDCVSGACVSGVCN
jgi:hypothetical protein